MRPAAARLLVLQGGSAYRRLAGIVAGVALGVGMLLILLGAYLHMPERDNRAAWVSPQGEWVETTDDGDVVVPEADSETMLARATNDYFLGVNAAVTTVAASGNTGIEMPTGLPLPGPGEYYASPEMAELIDAHPADQLEDRFGERVGVLPRDMLKGPSQYGLIKGEEWSTLAELSNTVVLEEFPSEGPNAVSTTFRVVLAIGAIAILVPIVLLISIVGQLGAAERRDRFATVRLIGAGRKSVGWLSAWEMAIATGIGAVLGLGVAAALNPLATRLSLNGSTSYAADLTPSPLWAGVTLVLVTALGAFTAWRRTVSDDVGAPGASRERAEKPVTAWRTTTLVVGLAVFGGSAFLAQSGFGAPEILSFGIVIGFALIAFGIVIAGPWITRGVSKVFRSLASSAPAVVAAGRLERHPRATFRSVAGLVVAVFIVSVFAGGASAIQGLIEPEDRPGLLDSNAVMASIGTDVDVAEVGARLRGVEGTEHVAFGYLPDDDSNGTVMARDDALAIGAIDLPDSTGVTIDLFGMLADAGEGGGVSIDPPAAADTPVTDTTSYAVVVTDGTPASIERARTALLVHADADLTPLTRADYANAGTAEVTNELAVMAYLGMGIAIGVSALALAVATAAAALDRKRTFGLLRLAGMPVRQLRSTISIEATVPLMATLLASAGLGFGVAWVIIEVMGNGLKTSWPDPRYWWAIAAALAIAAAAVSASFGTVRRSTELESTRFE